MKRLSLFLGLVGIYCLTAWAQEREPVIERDRTLLQNSQADEAGRRAQRHGGPMPSFITVTSSADSGPGTLRQALLDAKLYDTITFDPAVFPANAPATIVLSSDLPQLTQGHLTIDASNAGVILNGSNITTPPPESHNGISISSDYNIVRGLQIVGFSDAGIALARGAQYNLIGGNRTIGKGPLGQGNLLSGNNIGVGLWDEATSHNTIQGNSIGITLDGTATWGNTRDGVHSNGATQNLLVDNVIGGSEDAGIYLCCVVNGNNTVTHNWIGIGPGGSSHGNGVAGVLIDRTRYNVVGPGNVIAHNKGQGVEFWEETSNNTITENIIHDNGGCGILFTNPGQSALQPKPVIFSFDIKAGTVSGVACANCTVEIFSDTGDEGGIYEGQTKSGEDGAFTFAKGASLAGPNLTATATQTDGNTSEFSPPTQGSSQNPSLQVGNALPIFLLQTRPPNLLADNRIGGTATALPYTPGMWSDGEKWMRVVVDPTGKWQHVDWSKDEYVIDPNEEGTIDDLVSQGIRIMLYLDVWSDIYPQTVYYKSESDIAIYSNWVRFMVRHFKGRVKYYEMCGPRLAFERPEGMPVESYTYLVKRIAPIIREEDPQAKMVVGAVPDTRLGAARDWMWGLLKSEVMPLVDGISWCPMYGAAPSDDPRGVRYPDQMPNYWENYPALVEEIRSTATAHGFHGEFLANEMQWSTPDMCVWDVPCDYTDVAGAKYYGRAIIIHLGLDVVAGLGIVQESNRPRSNSVIRYLCSIMAGAQPMELPIVIESEASNIKHYGFSQSNGDYLVAVWRDNAAVDFDPGIASIISIPGFSNWHAAGMDILNGFEQELITRNENGNLIIRDLLIKDYPLVIRLSK
jgi:parallel beta-helix repeat protein